MTERRKPRLVSLSSIRFRSAETWAERAEATARGKDPHRPFDLRRELPVSYLETVEAMTRAVRVWQLQYQPLGQRLRFRLPPDDVHFAVALDDVLDVVAVDPPTQELARELVRLGDEAGHGGATVTMLQCVLQGLEIPYERVPIETFGELVPLGAHTEPGR